MEAFRVGVSLAMTNNVSEALGAMSRELLGVHAQVTRLQEGFSSLKGVIAGALSAAAGVALLDKMGEIIVKAGELQRVMNNMTLSGMGEAEVEQAMNASWSLTRKYRTLGADRIAAMITEVRSVYGDTDSAVKNIEPALQAATVLKSQMPGQRGEGLVDQVFRMFKTADLRNVTDSPDATRAFFQDMTKVITATGGKITPSDFLMMTKYSKSAGQTWTDEFITRVAASVMQEGSPSTVGQSLASMDQAVVGGRLTKKSAMGFMDLGLLRPDKIIWNNAGDVKGVEAGGIEGSELFRQDPYRWVQSILRPAMERSGHGTIEAQSTVLANLFGNRNAEWIANTMLKDRPIERDRALIGKAMGLEGSGLVLDKDLGTSIEGLKTAWNNFLMALGAPLVQQAVDLLNKLTDTINQAAQWAALKENAGVVEALGKGIAVLGVALVAGGAVAIMAALGPAGWIAAGLVALGAGIVAFKPQIEALGQYFVDLNQKWAEQKDAFVAKVSEWIQAFVQWIEGLNQKWEEIKQGWVTAAGTFVTSMIDEIKSWPGRLVETIKGFVANLVSSILQGLRNMLPNWMQGMMGASPASFGGGGGGPAATLAAMGTQATVDGIPGLSGDTKGLNADFARRLQSLHAAAKAAGHGFSVTDGHRTHAQQMDVFRRKPHLAARPGNSHHEFGVAADLRYSSPAANKWVIENAPRFGLHIPMLRELGSKKHEPWHIEPIQSRGARTPPTPDAGPVKIHQAVHLDGGKFASNVTRRQVDMANGPSHGAQSFDGTRHHAGPEAAFLNV